MYGDFSPAATRISHRTCTHVLLLMALAKTGLIWRLMLLLRLSSVQEGGHDPLKDKRMKGFKASYIKWWRELMGRCAWVHGACMPRVR